MTQCSSPPQFYPTHCWLTLYEVCPESIQPFRISREPVKWFWCNLAASQRRPYCSFVNSHSTMGLVSWRETPLTELVYCMTVAFTMTERADQLHHDNAPAHSKALVQAFFGGAKHHITQVRQSRFGCLRLLAFPKAKIAVQMEEICECDGHTVHKLSQRCLTADWLGPRESDCSRIHSKVSCNWLPIYVKATWPIVEIFKMAGQFPDSPLIQW
jgi:hypothetical protein